MDITEQTLSEIQDLGFLELNPKDLFFQLKKNNLLFSIDDSKIIYENISESDFISLCEDSTSLIYKHLNFYPSIKLAGSVETNPTDLSVILNTDKNWILSEFNNPNSKVKQKYLQGLTESKMKRKLAFNLDAESGDAKALKIIEKLIDDERIRLIKEEFDA